MTFEYKCVAGPTIVAVKSAKARDHAVKAFEEIMNAEAASGWEYVGIDEFHVSEPQGLFTRKRIYVPSKILVFRRLKEKPVAVVPAPPAVTVQPEPSSAALPAAALPAPSAPLVARDVEAHAQDAPKSMKAIADKLKTA